MKCYLLVSLAMLASLCRAQLWVPAVFGDHMVLQQGMPVHVWGKDTPGTLVQASLAGKKAQAKAGADGTWSLKLPALKPGGPYELAIQGSSSKNFQDVILGEVWLGSGQSNMELTMAATQDRDAEIPKANLPRLRLFTVERQASVDPQADVKGEWKVCTPDNVKGFSAVAYHFARQLQAALSNVPLGMIVSCWGGTPAEDWAPRSALLKVPETAKLVEGWDAEPDRNLLWSIGQDYELQVRNLKLVPKTGSGAREISLQGMVPIHSEKPGSSGQAMINNGELHYSGKILGGAWGTVSLPLAAAGQSKDLSAYQALEFEAQGKGDFALSFSQPSITDFDNYISQPFKAGPGWQSQRIELASLKQGGWGEPKPLTLAQISSINFAIQVPYAPEFASVTYNGMIAPLLGLGLRGVIWYQGEANAGRPGPYGRLLSAMIQAWRGAWHEARMPFLVVQLPGWADSWQDSWAQLRQAQLQAVQLTPETALVSTLDLGASHDIHPKNKKPVGQRLAWAALKVAYGRKDGRFSAWPKALKAQGKLLRCRFEAGAGLKASGELSGFEVAGADGVFHAAQAKLQGSEVQAWSAEVPKPKALRYAWAADPKPSLFDGAGVPVGTFEMELGK